MELPAASLPCQRRSWLAAGPWLSSEGRKEGLGNIRGARGEMSANRNFPGIGVHGGNAGILPARNRMQFRARCKPCVHRTDFAWRPFWVCCLLLARNRLVLREESLRREQGIDRCCNSRFRLCLGHPSQCAERNSIAQHPTHYEPATAINLAVDSSSSRTIGERSFGSLSTHMPHGAIITPGGSDGHCRDCRSTGW
jgi:hypothetical protein